MEAGVLLLTTMMKPFQMTKYFFVRSVPGKAWSGKILSSTEFDLVVDLVELEKLLHSRIRCTELKICGELILTQTVLLLPAWATRSVTAA